MNNGGAPFGLDDIHDLDFSILLDIDVSEIQAPRLRLEDLEHIDWEHVASGVLGVTDPIGQLREWLASVLSSFFDVIKNFISSLVTPVASAVSQILSIVSQIPSALTSLASMLRDVVVEPIRNVIAFAMEAFTRMRELVSTIASAISNAFNALQERVRESIARIADALSGVLARISDVAQTILDALGKIPHAVSDVVAAITRTLDSVKTSFTNTLTEVTNRLAQIPTIIADMASKLGAVLNELATRVRDVVVTALNEIASRLAQIPTVIADIMNKLGTMLGEFVSRLREAFASLVNAVGETFNRIRSTFETALVSIGNALASAVSAVSHNISIIIDNITKIGDAVGGLTQRIVSALSSVFESARGQIETFVKQLASLLGAIPAAVENIMTQVVGLGETAAGFVTRAFNTVAQWIQEATKILHGVGAALQGFMNAVLRLPSELWNLLPAEIRNAFLALYNFFTQTVPRFFIEDIPNFFRQAYKFITEELPRFFTQELPKRLSEFGKWLWDQIPDWLKNVFTAIYDFFTKTVPKFFIEDIPRFFTQELPKRLSEFGKWIWDQIPDWLKNAIIALYNFFTQTVPEVLTKDIPNFFKNASEFVKQVLTWIGELPKKLEEFAKWVWDNLPEPVKNLLDVLHRAFNRVREEFEQFVKDPAKYIGDKLIKPAWDTASNVISIIGNALGKIYDALTNALKTALSAVINATSFLAGVVMSLINSVFKQMARFVDAVWNAVSAVFGIKLVGNSEFVVAEWYQFAKEVEDIFQTGYMRAEGIGNQLWWAGAQLIIPFWRATLMAYLLRGIAKTFYDFELRIEPEVAGTKMAGTTWRFNMGEFMTAVLEGLPAFANAYAIGTSFAIAQLYLQNVQHLYAPRAVQYYDKVKDRLIGDVARAFGYNNAIYNFFIKTPSVNELVEWARRWVASIRGHKPDAGVVTKAEGVSAEARAGNMAQVLDTIRLHMLYHGLPRWYIEYMTQDPEKFVIEFRDRFGVVRKLSLSPLYELPTHSEMARMTQRDVFPGVDVMKALGWVRGWTEDLTTMTYLLTFKYPSFEKLWEFYMRATAGMLWFKAPDTAKTVFAKEAQEIGAGVPIDPLTIQRALAVRGPGGLAAVELALNTYLKWLEYSNFSWFTEKTEMYGINVGQQIVSALGGWTADSWLMWDVAADIPTKIDMRWMSRFGIFMLMAERIGEEFFRAYTPMVDVVGKMLDSEPRSKIAVELHWFSKLLQATGLHPAWVPLTTVAENIMVISDEMTLLRTGWLNLFRDGLITHDVMDKSLGGLFTVSYKVGYWNPDTKTWTTGWVNLPVRWLPHESKLLQYRALIDRVVLLYRRLHGYLQSAVRAMVITPQEARDVALKFAEMLNKHYAKIGREITGFDVRLNIDDEYISLWLHTMQYLGLYEAYRRARAWWSRVSGWLLFRIAQGYVDEEDVIRIIREVKDAVKLTDVEVNAYVALTRALFGAVVAKERVPTPWQLATLAEYMAVAPSLIAKSIETHRIAEEYRDLLARYIAVKPLKSDYRAVITDAMRLYRLGRIDKSTLDAIIEAARNYGFTEPEIALLKLRGEMLSLLADTETRSLRVPTPWQLATLAEYVTIPANLVAKSIAEYGVDPDYIPLVQRYIAVRPLKSDYRALISQAVRALRYGVITRETFETILRNALSYGFTEPEIQLIKTSAELALAVEETREYVPTPLQLATLAEYIPEVRQYMRQVFETRRVRGVWAEVWSRYIYLRPVVDEVRRWASAVFALVERGIVPTAALDDALKVLSTYGYEELERQLIAKTIMANAARRVWGELLGSAGRLAAMSRYSDVAMDMAWSRIQRIIDMLPADSATKEAIKTMWRQYITHYQNYPEIRAYVSELVTAYAQGVLTDAEFERELNYLRQLGVPEMTIALIRRRAQLRRARTLATRRR